jgi:transposase
MRLSNHKEVTMLKPHSPQASFYGTYLYDRIVPVDHLLRKINQVVDFSFIKELVQDKYSADFGRPAEDPEFMLRLCLLQYLYGDSDREVVANARLNLAYKYFLGLAVDEEVPDDSTLSYFRAIRLGEEKFRQIFEKLVLQCQDKGLVTGKRQIIDSTHIIADMAMNSLAGVIKLCRQNVLKSIEKQDTQKAEKLGLKTIKITQQDRFISKEDGLKAELAAATTLLDQVTKELRIKRLKVTPELQKDLGLLEKAVADRAEGTEDRLVSPVDPDARGGRKPSKSWVGYKGHMIIEEESEIITAIETTPANQDDGNELKILLNQQKENLSLVPAELLGDKGYDAGANLEFIEGEKITGYICLREANHIDPNFFTVNDFTYDEAKNTLTCPTGNTAPHYRKAVYHCKDQKRKGIVFEFNPEQCHHCELKPLCNNAKGGRQVYISYYEPLFEQMQARLSSEEGKQAYKQRYKIEQKVADLARYCGMRHCRYRTLQRAGIHTLLAAIASNVKRMARLLYHSIDKPLESLVMAS